MLDDSQADYLKNLKQTIKHQVAAAIKARASLHLHYDPDAATTVPREEWHKEFTSLIDQLTDQLILNEFQRRILSLKLMQLTWLSDHAESTEDSHDQILEELVGFLDNLMHLAPEQVTDFIANNFRLNAGQQRSLKLKVKQLLPSVNAQSMSDPDSQYWTAIFGLLYEQVNYDPNFPVNRYYVPSMYSRSIPGLQVPNAEAAQSGSSYNYFKAYMNGLRDSRAEQDKSIGVLYALQTDLPKWLRDHGVKLTHAFLEEFHREIGSLNTSIQNIKDKNKAYEWLCDSLYSFLVRNLSVKQQPRSLDESEV